MKPTRVGVGQWEARLTHDWSIMSSNFIKC